MTYNSTSPSPEEISDQDLATNTPFAYLMREKTDALRRMDDGMVGILYCSRVEKKEGKALRSTVFKLMEIESNIGPEKSFVDAVGAFFASLHDLILTQPEDRSNIPTLSPKAFFDLSVEKYCPLLAALYGIATGHTREESSRNNKIVAIGYQDYQSQFLACSIARDLLLRCTVKYPLHTQLMIGNLMETRTCSASLKHLLSALRIAYSQDFSDIIKCKKALATFVRGIELSGNEMCLINGDNCGFLRKGLETGYNEYIVFQEIVLRHAQLSRLNIENDNKLMQKCRRPTHSWLDLCSSDKDVNKLANEVVKINESDYDHLTHAVMEGITYARELELNHGICVGSSILRTGYIINHDTRLQLERGELHSSDNAGSDAPSSFYGDNITLNCVNVSLAKRSSCEAIAQYCWDVRKKILKTWYDDYGEKYGDFPHDGVADVELPPASIGAIFMCDGQPAAQFSTIIAEDNRKYYLGEDGEIRDDDIASIEETTVDNDGGELASNDHFEEWFNSINQRFGFVGNGHGLRSRFYGKLMAFPGSFHAGMKFLNCMGMMFTNFYRLFISPFRDTTNKQDYYLFPKDPRQTVSELPQLIMAHYRSAFNYCRESFHEEGNSITPTAEDVHRYMIERAKTSPFRQATLMLLRYGEIFKMLQMAPKLEVDKCADMFLRCIRFALPLWATTHAVDYVRLGVDMLVLFKCASPALKQLYSNEIFARLTAKGLKIAADEAMEKSIQHIRIRCGKLDKPNMQKTIEHACAVIPFNATNDNTREELRNSSGAGESKQSLHRQFMTITGTSPLVSAYELIHNTIKLWHPIDEPIIGNYQKETKLHAEPYSYQLPECETLNPNVTNFVEIGTNRVTKYIQVNYIDNPFKVGRSELDVPLTKILTTSVDRKEELIKAINRVASIDKSELDKAFNKDEVGNALMWVVRKLNTGFGQIPVTQMHSVSLSRLNKEKRIEKLIELRTEYFNKDPTAKSTLEQKVRDEFKRKYPDFATGIEGDGNVLDHKIYSLSDNIMRLNRYKSIGS